MNRQNIIYAALLLLFFGLLFVNARLHPETRGQGNVQGVQQQQIPLKITVSQNIYFDNDSVRRFNNITFDNGTTALDLLKKTTDAKTEGVGKNAFVTQIDRVEADKEVRQFWAFYVNGKQAEVGAGSYVLKDKDIIEWKLETY